uniref:Uncharacterized protein n=1 Tax=Craspedostauros australis TaxID=1486917 RepID=A0A7R9WN82_9STRA|mmetsp:Transcript_12856/g.35501  ORF Transcript_12856/g.35501 Transcript_12856/m.35501 type:complete len:215 (+) Transcript_12856:133-777(+)
MRCNCVLASTASPGAARRDNAQAQRPAPAQAQQDQSGDDSDDDDDLILPRQFMNAPVQHHDHADDGMDDANNDDGMGEGVRPRAALPGLDQQPQHEQRRRTNITHATIPPPRNPSKPTICEIRHQAQYLQRLACSPKLQEILQQPPYRMPREIVQQLVNIADLQSLFRRMVVPRMSLMMHPNIKVDSPVSVDIVMLCSRMLSWYSREREHDHGF